MRLGALAAGRDNNYTLIRFVAATAVIVSHAFAYTGGGPEPWHAAIGFTPGGIAVAVFFVVSGFLVTRSLDFRQSGVDFVCARGLRIFPGLAVNLLFVACVLGPAISTVPLGRYFSDARVPVYVLRNLQLLFLPYPEGALPGVMISNGSLWTLPVEVCCYLLLLTLWIAAKSLRRWSPSGGATALAALAIAALAAWRYSQAAGFTLAWMFVSGAAFYVLRERIEISARWGAVALVVLLSSALDRRLFHGALLLTAPYLVFCVAYLPRGAIRAFNRTGDTSYGLYIYAAPVQIAAVHVFPTATVAQHLVLVFPITLALAVLSWRLVEAPSLRMAPRLQGRVRALLASGRPMASR